jgi:hypothetical protein
MRTTTRLQVNPIAPDVVAQLRRSDDLANPPTTVVDAHGGSPVRCCLRMSRPGETLLLVSYAPLRRWAAREGVDPGAYDEVGPVFIHPGECGGPTNAGYPEQLRGTRRMMRAYSASGRLLSGRLVEPDDDPEAVLAELFDDDDVAVVHARAVEFGCFTFEISR